MGFRIEGLGSDDFFNNFGLVGTEVKIANQYLRNNTSSNRQENSVNREDKVGVEIRGYNDSSRTQKGKNNKYSKTSSDNQDVKNNTSTSYSNKVDPSKGYHEMEIYNGFSIQVPNDTSWKNTPLRDEDIVSREENTHQNGTEIITKYADGTVVKEYYSKNGVHVTQETRYSGDPNNPQEGDVRSTKTTYESEEGTVVTNSNSYWIHSLRTISAITDGQWFSFSDLVSRPNSDYEVYDQDGNRVPYEMGPTSDYNRIKDGSMMIYPPSEGFFDIP